MFAINPEYMNETVLLDECTPIYLDIGPLWEQVVARVTQWFGVILSLVFLIYYIWNTYKATCGWEELYVCTVEFCKIIIELYFEYTPPAMIFQTNGQVTPWLRYAEWLLTCPVILIHLSNITGLNDDYSGRTMSLITSDLGGICMAVTAALSKGWLKALFFVIGCGYGASTFYNAACIYIESYYTMPQGICRRLVLWMAGVFFTSWFMFPGLFLAGPEGTQALSWAGTTIGHTVADLLSKNAWGMIGHFLRVEIHKHIIIHGDVRRPVTVKALGRQVSVNCFVDKEEEEEDERISTKTYANRNSFVKMRDDMEKKGVLTRKSLDTKEGPKLSAGHVVVAVADPMINQFFSQQFEQLSEAVQLTTVLGPPQLDQVMQKGGFDGVLLAPEYLQQGGIVQMIKETHRTPVYAYGWGKTSPIRQLIENSGVDGWLEGPSFGSTFSNEALEDAIAHMQSIKASYAVSMNNFGMGGMGMGGMSGNNMQSVPMMGGMQNMSPHGSVGNMQAMDQRQPGSPQVPAGNMYNGMQQQQQAQPQNGMQHMPPQGNMQQMGQQGNMYNGMQQPQSVQMQPMSPQGNMMQMNPQQGGMQTQTPPVGTPPGMQTPPQMNSQMDAIQLQQMLYYMQQQQQQGGNWT
mmetsp:Transcript_2452/g.6189  ORF Transcript_2452/g.6189 Transcript_2452/m.6189 type:complete len:631 (-) Transcript_2452:284-2176(-)